MAANTDHHKPQSRATKRQIVYTAARKHHVPPWLLWGVFGAESTWGTNGTNYFGLIEPTYTMYNGNTRSPKNTADLAESADIAAELLYSLKQEHGSWAGAVAQYAPYSISHPRELSRQGQSEGREFVDLEFKIPGGLIPGGKLPFPGPNVNVGPGAGLEALEGLAGDTPLGGITEGIGGITDLTVSIKDMAAFFVGAGELLLTPEGWLRLGKLFGGAVFVIWGLRIVIRESTGTDPVKAATKTASKVAETAAIVATVK